MKKYIGLLLVSFLILGFTSNKIEELISKEIKSTLKITTYNKESISISKSINRDLPTQITPNNFYKISNNGEIKGYYFKGKAFGKVNYFDFIVVFDSNLIVAKVKVVHYKEDHGGEVKSTRWLKQFTGTQPNKVLVYQKDIAAISGATLSAKSLTHEVNNILKTVAVLQTQKVL